MTITWVAPPTVAEIERQNALIRRMWHAGKSANDIADVIKVTRNTVSGRLARMGLTGKDRDEGVVKPRIGSKVPADPKRIRKTPSASLAPIAKIANPRLGPAKKPLEPIFNRPASQRLSPLPPDHRPLQDREAPIPFPGMGKTIVELDPGACRYPLGRPFDRVHLFCAGPAMQDRPYCPIHSRLAMSVPHFRGARTGV